MNAAGIDYSTKAIDLVMADVDDPGITRWWHWDLCATGDAFDRTRVVPLVVPGRRSVYWDDVLVIGIEEPMARGVRSVQLVPKLKAIQGAILACIPAMKAVIPLDAKSWRAGVGLSGNAPKDVVQAWARTQIIATGRDGPIAEWTQDAFDAYCIARSALAKVDR